MVKIGLQLKATLENLEYIETCGDDFRWYMKLRCICGEVTKHWQYVTLLESVPTKGGRGYSSLVEKCKLCSRENHVDIIKDSIKRYTSDDDGKFKTVVSFECRGPEPVEFDLRQGWVAQSSLSNTIFDEVDLKDKEWYDYDGEGSGTVSITEISSQFIKLK